jgi:hypothetical protein
MAGQSILRDGLNRHRRNSDCLSIYRVLGRTESAAKRGDRWVTEHRLSALSDLAGMRKLATVVSLLLQAMKIMQSTRVSHRTMSISIPEPSHDPQMRAIFRGWSTSKQSSRKYLIQSSYLPLRLVFYLTRRRTCLFGVVFRIGQRSIVLYLLLNGLSDRAIHDDLIATLGPKAVAYNTMTRYLREAKPGTAEITLDLNQVNLISSHLDDYPRLSWQPWKKRKAVFVRARTCPSHSCSTRYRL